MTTNKVRKTRLGMHNKNWYKEKIQGCVILAEKTDKKITLPVIKKTADTVKMPAHILVNAWKTFQETGGSYVDKRVSTLKGTIKMKPTVKVANIKKNKKINAKKAAEIILEYMTSNKLNSRELCNKYNISLAQFYGWINELSVSGTLMGHMILDVTEYAKLPVVDVIWYNKYPNTQRKSIKYLTTLQRKQYSRVATVLLKYLPDVKVTK